jgi:hypothetical protein
MKMISARLAGKYAQKYLQITGNVAVFEDRYRKWKTSSSATAGDFNLPR